MKIFEFDSAEDIADGAVAREVDGDGNPVAVTLSLAYRLRLSKMRSNPTA